MRFTCDQCGAGVGTLRDGEAEIPGRCWRDLKAEACDIAQARARNLRVLIPMDDAPSPEAGANHDRGA